MTGTKRLAQLLLLTTITTLPSCLTAHMWSTYEPEWRSAHSTYTERQLHSAGKLCFASNGAADSRLSVMWNREGSPELAGRLSLTPAGGTRNSLKTLIASPATSSVSAQLRSQVAEFHGSIRQWTTIDVQYTILPGAAGYCITEGLPWRLTDRMQPIELSSLSSNSAISNLRVFMTHCVGLSSDWKLEAWQVTDKSLQPIAGATAESLLHGGNRQHLVVGRFRSARGITYGAVPADVVALIADSKLLDPASGKCLHSSRWLAELPREDEADKPIGMLADVSESVTHTTKRTRMNPTLDGAFFARVGATPLVLACDIALGPGLVELWKALSSDKKSPTPPAWLPRTN